MAKRRTMKLVSRIEAERDDRTVVDQQTEAAMVRGDTGDVDWLCGGCRSLLVEHAAGQPAVNYDDVLLRCRCGAINAPPG